MAPSLTVNRREVRLTNLQRILWPEEELTKRDLIRYYIQVAPYLLPHLANRPLVVQRFPRGIHGEGFYQKNIPAGAPCWLTTCPVSHREGKVTRYVVAENLETLVWLGNQACLELHPWLSSLNHLERPDFCVFDLDPMENSTFDQVRQVAQAIRDTLEALGLKSYPKLSGATGIQIYLPVKPLYTYDQVRRFAEVVCLRVHELLPEITSLARAVGERGGKVYLDYLQNVYGKTLAAPYSPRPLPGAPVSMPLDWSEVGPGGPAPGDFTILNALPRLERYGDRFAPVLEEKQELPLI
ncbi:MAG: DNA polymerase domain-containing protein [Firmicutes bacterium]|nr:DNA polymerase domain-containing protein [Bacillota bacterium]